MMNIKAQRLSVAHEDSTLTSEATFVRTAITATALSSKNPEASAAFSKLLWALGSSPPLDDVGEIADRWIKTIEEAGLVGEAVDPKRLLQTLMIGAEACM
jgi:hypothetical protein